MTYPGEGREILTISGKSDHGYGSFINCGGFFKIVFTVRALEFSRAYMANVIIFHSNELILCNDLWNYLEKQEIIIFHVSKFYNFCIF